MSEEKDVKQEVKEAQDASGIKSNVANTVAINEAERGEPEEKGVEFPDFFLEEDENIRVSVYVVYNEKGKPLIMATAPNMDEKAPKDEFKYLNRVVLWADFSAPTYEDMVHYREVCLTYDDNTGKYLTNPVKMRLLYIKHHLKDWSVTDSKGNKIEIVREDGVLTDDCLRKVFSIMPSLMDLILTEFEREALLTSM